MTRQWTNYSLCCCISAALMLRMIIKQNTKIVILTLFLRHPISFYIFDNTLPCEFPEDKQSNFTQVWKVMEKWHLPVVQVHFLIYDDDKVRILTKTRPYFLLHIMCPNTNWKQKYIANGGGVEAIQEASLRSVWGFIHSSMQCNQKGPNKKLVEALLRRLVCIIN